MRRIRKTIKYKRTVNYLCALFFALLCFVGAFLSFRSGNLSLSQMDKYTGRVIEKGLTTNKASGKETLNRRVFYFKLNGLNQKLAYYRPSQNYADLFSMINVDDVITVYFTNLPDSNAPNIKTYQIEKKGMTILDRKDYQLREDIGGYLSFIAGLSMLGAALYQDKKYWKTHNEK